MSRYDSRRDELYCHICGVTFSVSRRRLEPEPYTASWGDIGGYDSSFATSNCNHPDCVVINRARRLASHSYDYTSPVATAWVHSDGKAKEMRYSAADTMANILNPPLEHIPSENCSSTQAYSGRRISAEAMRGCSTYQCLVVKQNEWIPSLDDEDFEISGDYFLSGLGSHMISLSFISLPAFPSRHGCEMPIEDNTTEFTRTEADGLIRVGQAMPFHPTCLEIFKRASLDRYDFIDIDGLMQWWKYEGASAIVDNKFPRHAAVKRGRTSQWSHNVGDEFLGANPCFVPGLQDILDSVQDDSDFGKGPTADHGVLTVKIHNDPFSKLPEEMKLEILLDLDTWDIANLRVASRSFRQLPQLLFYHLTLRELPWLYEAWTSLPLSFWATTTASEQRNLRSALEDTQSTLAFVFSKEVKNECAKKVKELEDAISDRPTMAVTLLDRHKTDWYTVISR